MNAKSASAKITVLCLSSGVSEVKANLSQSLPDFEPKTAKSFLNFAGKNDTEKYSCFSR